MIFFYSFFCDRFLRKAAGKVPATSGEGGFSVHGSFLALPRVLCSICAFETSPLSFYDLVHESRLRTRGWL